MRVSTVQSILGLLKQRRHFYFSRMVKIVLYFFREKSYNVVTVELSQLKLGDGTMMIKASTPDSGTKTYGSYIDFINDWYKGILLLAEEIHFLYYESATEAMLDVGRFIDDADFRSGELSAKTELTYDHRDSTYNVTIRMEGLEVCKMK